MHETRTATNNSTIESTNSTMKAYTSKQIQVIVVVTWNKTLYHNIMALLEKELERLQ
jgi:hypothetical protein